MHDFNYPYTLKGFLDNIYVCGHETCAPKLNGFGKVLSDKCVCLLVLCEDVIGIKPVEDS